MTTTPTDDAASSSPGTSAPDSAEQGTTERGSTEQGTAEQDTAAELADAMTRAIKRIRRLTSERLEPYGITPGQGRALRTLAHAPGCELPDRAMRLSDLADRLHIAPARPPRWSTRWRRPDWWNGPRTRPTAGPCGSC